MLLIFFKNTLKSSLLLGQVQLFINNLTLLNDAGNKEKPVNMLIALALLSFYL
jgi:hypothetical protein